MKQVYDNIRKQWVAATPEEIVRQRWILKMVQELGFPKELLVIERELKMLPHLQQHPHPLPNRRVDLLSFGKGASSIFPLLLIECKDEALSQQALDQAMAYNTFVQAFYVAIVNQNQVRLRYNLTCSMCEIDRLPSFKELMEAVT
jgi:7-keto-8-aminopelargonate synthetase-like enzyme